jgi:hypothetical protein
VVKLRSIGNRHVDPPPSSDGPIYETADLLRVGNVGLHDLYSSVVPADLPSDLLEAIEPSGAQNQPVASFCQPESGLATDPR